MPVLPFFNPKMAGGGGRESVWFPPPMFVPKMYFLKKRNKALVFGCF